MKIVIEIPDKIYDGIKKRFPNYLSYLDVSVMANAILNGTPLPKGHGDLKDVSRIHLDKFVDCRNYSLHPLHSEDFKRGYNSAIDDVWNVLREAQTIVEADKEGAEE